MEQVTEKNETLSWAAFLGCMFVGMGIDMIFGYDGAGMIIGMGVGYIASAIIESRKEK